MDLNINSNPLYSQPSQVWTPVPIASLFFTDVQAGKGILASPLENTLITKSLCNERLYCYL